MTLPTPVLEGVSGYQQLDNRCPPKFASYYNGSGSDIPANALVELDDSVTTHGAGAAIKASASSTAKNRRLSIGYTRQAIPAGEWGQVRLFKTGTYLVDVNCASGILAGGFLTVSATVDGQLAAATEGTHHVYAVAVADEASNLVTAVCL